MIGHHRDLAEIDHHFSQFSFGEALIFTHLLEMPFTLQTMVRMANLGYPLITGSIERYGVTADFYSVLALNSEETVIHLFTPLTSTLSSAGVRRITRFTFDFLSGTIWRAGNPVIELQGIFPCRFVGGMNAQLMRAQQEFTSYLSSRIGARIRADCVFVPRAITERTIHRPASLLGDANRRDDIQGREQEQVLYGKTSGATWFRTVLFEQQFKSIGVQLERAMLMSASGGTDIAFCPEVERAYTFHATPDGHFSLPQPGTGRWGMEAMNNHNFIAHVLNGQQGVVLRHGPFLSGF